MTSVVRFIKETELGSVFDDQATKAMGEAFDAACKVLHETGQSSVVYEAVAKCIIEIAKSGERDPNLSSWPIAYGRRMVESRSAQSSRATGNS